MAVKKQIKRRKRTSTKSAIGSEVAEFKRERILQEAAILFFERGYIATTLDDVAQTLGITKPFIYNYFSSKIDILAAVCEHSTFAALDTIKILSVASGSPAERLSQFVRAFTLQILGNHMNNSIFFREEKSIPKSVVERVHNAQKEFDRCLKGFLKEGVKSGDFRLSDPDIAVLAIGGMVSWAYSWYRPNGRLAPEDIAEQMDELVLQMVGVREASSSRRMESIAQ